METVYGIVSSYTAATVPAFNSVIITGGAGCLETFEFTDL